jgi:phospholipid/cholesterol/gamma-HCH transport system substrate-binding protein
MNNFSTISDTLARIELNKTLNTLNSTVKDLDLIFGKVESSKGSLGLLVNDPGLYQNLNYSIESLNHLLIDFRQNPKRYIHFSAIDMGRKVAAASPKNDQSGDSVIFKVFLLMSETPIGTDSPLLKGISNVNEVKSGTRYYYFTGHETSYNKIREILHKTQSAFPEASLKAFRNEKEISLKKALKTISK